MASQMFAIVQYGEAWRIVDNDGQRGEPQSYDKALARAEGLARRARWQGLDAEVLVHRGGRASRAPDIPRLSSR